ncbi:MAG TPA: hypothetical protein PKD55_09705, partial [Bellilinea sp.]|nr:hypothetical protein [Bellilinea sp.]
QQLIDSIAEHLKGAQAAQRKLFGRFEIYRLSASNMTFGQLLPQLQDQLRPLLGNGDSDLNTRPIAELSADDKAKIEGPLGTRLQNEIYRDVLLSSISNLWVEHLTKVDALRVSIGLEAYAQRDPLVMYKGKATEMFHDLLNDIRSAVVSRILTYQPVRRSQVAEAVQEPSVPAEADHGTSQRPVAVSAGQPSSGKKRKRHRK